MKATVYLAWPDRRLTPNSHGHWRPKYEAAKTARSIAATAAYFHGLHRVGWGEGEINVHITAFPPDRRRRDRDNLLASLKASMDGLADGMQVDDSRFVYHAVKWGEPRKGGEIEVTFSNPQAA
ncbi:MAG: hypothetical protein KGL35_08580 [Bradyrhizobium sp.]|nr:hypothetical protein [Bradyrhizobium sp.]